ncbi:hypothetical protein D9M72_582650 [compost metagenome]
MPGCGGDDGDELHDRSHVQFGNEGDDQSDDPGFAARQRPRPGVGLISQLLDCRLNLFAGLFGNGPLAAQDVGDGALGDTGCFRDVFAGWHSSPPPLSPGFSAVAAPQVRSRYASSMRIEKSMARITFALQRLFWRSAGRRRTGPVIARSVSSSGPGPGNRQWPLPRRAV